MGIVVVVGSTNTDLVVRTERLPGPGETVLGGDLLTFAGGKGANQAVAAARAGARVRFIGAFGDDDFGRARRADLEREGVDCSRCPVKRGVPSGVALIAIGEGGGRRGAKAENLILVAPGANARLTPEDVKRAMPKLGQNDALVCSLEVPLPTVAAAMQSARRSGCNNVILNPAPMPAGGLPKSFRPAILTPNETEFEALFGAPPGSPAALRSFGRLRGAVVLVTRGPRGVMFYGRDGGGRPFCQPRSAVPPKVRPVDTVGAGDCFNGSLAARLAAGDGLFAALSFATTAAAIKVTRHGAQAGMPRRAEVLRLLRTCR